jgi:hypothetical protein
LFKFEINKFKKISPAPSLPKRGIYVPLKKGMKEALIITAIHRLTIWCSLIGFLIIALFPAPTIAATDPRPRRAGIKIQVPAGGIFRVTGQDIQETGVNPETIDPESLRMFRRDTEIPIIVRSTGSSLGASGAVEFYAQGIDNQYTGTDVYWLYWGKDAGKRMTASDGSVDGSMGTATTFKDLLRVEENHTLWAETPGAPDADYWFWEKFTSPQTKTYSFDIPSLVKNSADAVITVYFQGRTGESSMASHHTVATVNGNPVSDEVWEGSLGLAQSGAIEQNLLNAGSNQIKIQSKQTSGAPDVVYFNRIEVDYQRALTAINNELEFTLAQDGPVKVSVKGFGSSNIRVFDISDPADPRRVSNVQIQADQDKFTVFFAHKGGEKTYYAIESSRIASPEKIAYRKFSDLKKTSNRADYVVITGKDFMGAVENLAELRRRQGRVVKKVDIEEIYDLFSFGFFDPEAIRSFLKYAHENWDLPRLEYVLLAGDANLDYRDYFGTSKQNVVPVYLDKTLELGLTPSDNWYGCVEGDDRVPELYIGRIPGDSTSTVSAIVNKMIRYESTQNQDSAGALFVADDDDAAFESLSDSLASYLPSGYAAEKIYTRLYDDLSKATKEIQSFVNQGMLITSFVGHGDVTRWGAEPFGGGDYILEPADLSAMTNKNRLTFVLPLDCLNGYFSQPFQYALAEEWVKAQNGGAIACFAPSGLSHQWEHELISQLVFSKIFLDDENRLGIVATQSKVDAYYAGASDNVLISFNLIGDPATRLAFHRKPADLVKVYAITATATSGGAISPAGETLVFDKADQSYSISPSAGYAISSVTVDGVSKGAISAYTFSNVTTDHAIRAAFEPEGGSGGGGGGGGCFVMTLMH